MGMEGLLSPQVLWLLLWLQLCRGKCRHPCPSDGASGHQWGHRDTPGNGVALKVPLR